MNNDLKKNIIDISYKHKLSHLGSVLSAVDIIEQIYTIKKDNEPFILSCGHAGLALYAVIEKHYGKKAEEILLEHNIHPDYCPDCHLDCSAGSLGHGLCISLGIALADRSRNVYCLISDGEATEGSIWEGLRIKQELNLDNLHVYCNWNNWGAYDKSNLNLREMLKEYGVILCDTTVEQLPFLIGQDAHYKTLSEEDYQLALKQYE